MSDTKEWEWLEECDKKTMAMLLYMKAAHQDADESPYPDMKRLIACIRTLREALEFYSKARVLMMTTNNSPWVAKDQTLGIFGSGFAAGTVHTRDDGNTARAALEKAAKGEL